MYASSSLATLCANLYFTELQQGKRQVEFSLSTATMPGCLALYCYEKWRARDWSPHAVTFRSLSLLKSSALLINLKRRKILIICDNVRQVSCEVTHWPTVCMFQYDASAIWAQSSEFKLPWECAGTGTCQCRQRYHWAFHPRRTGRRGGISVCAKQTPLLSHESSSTLVFDLTEEMMKSMMDTGMDVPKSKLQARIRWENTRKLFPIRITRRRTSATLASLQRVCNWCIWV